MAVDVQKLIDDARAAQSAARTASKNAQAQAAKDRVSAEVTARSKTLTACHMCTLLTTNTSKIEVLSSCWSFWYSMLIK